MSEISPNKSKDFRVQKSAGSRSSLQHLTPLQKYEAELKAFNEKKASDKLAQQIQNKEKVKEDFQQLRMGRIILMDEAGQPKQDIREDEKDKLENLSGFEKRKAVLAKSGVLNYLKPFYENDWNKALDMSEKNLTLAVSLNHSSFLLCT